MARTGGRKAALLVGAVALAAAGALWFGGGTAHANCPASDPNCMGDPGMGGSGSPSGGGSGCCCCGGSSDTQPPTTTVIIQQSSNGQTQPETPVQPQAPTKPRVYTPAPKARPAEPTVTGSAFIPSVPDTAPPAPPQPGPAVSLDGIDAPVPGAGTALIAGLPPAPATDNNSSPLLPGLILLAGAGLLALPLGAGGTQQPATGTTTAAPPPPPPPPPSSGPPVPADFYVYRSPVDNHFSVAKLGEGGVVAAGYAMVYGPDTYAGCWAFVAANAVDTGPYFHAAPPPVF